MGTVALNLTMIQAMISNVHPRPMAMESLKNILNLQPVRILAIDTYFFKKILHFKVVGIVLIVIHLPPFVLNHNSITVDENSTIDQENHDHWPLEKKKNGFFL